LRFHYCSGYFESIARGLGGQLAGLGREAVDAIFRKWGSATASQPGVSKMGLGEFEAALEEMGIDESDCGVQARP
jgi:hypothetical protein